MKYVQIKPILIGFLSLFFLMCVSSCSGSDNGKPKLTISVHKAGYGDAFIYQLTEAYNDSVDEEDEINFVIDSSGSVTDKFSNTIESGIGVSDLYFVLDTGWSRLALRDKLEPLDDIFEPLLPYMDPDYSAGCKMKVKNEEHYYVVPWSAGPSGICYNEKLFQEKAWTVPTTVSELKELIKKIETETDNKIHPFAYSADTQNYYEYLFQSWWLQYEGYEGWKTFWKFEDKSVYDSFGRHIACDTFYNLFYDKNSSGIANFDENAMYMYNDVNAAEQAVARGEAAMMVNQSCFYNEVRSYAISMGSPSLKMMKTPRIEKDFVYENDPTRYDAWNEEGVDENIAFCPTWDTILIPKASGNKELAKKFLAFINTPEGNKIFAKYSDMIRPINNIPGGTGSVRGISSFLKSCTGISDSCLVLQKITSYPMYYINGLTAWPANAEVNNPWYYFTASRSSDRIVPSVYFDKLNEYIGKNWDGWKANIND